MSVLAVLIALFSLVPLGYVVYMTAATGWDTAVGLIFRPRVGELLLNTVLLMVVTVPLCLVLGVGGAWLVERTTLRGPQVWAVLLAAPLAIPAFVNSYAWVSAVPSLGGLGSGVLIATLSYFPLVYIPAAATLGRLDPAIEQSAASLGLGAWRVFFRVVLPQLRIAMTGGALLVALHLLAEYGAFAMIRFDTFTTAIMVQYQSTFNGTAGNMLASVLVFFCLILLLSEKPRPRNGPLRTDRPRRSPGRACRCARRIGSRPSLPSSRWGAASASRCSLCPAGWSRRDRVWPTRVPARPPQTLGSAAGAAVITVVRLPWPTWPSATPAGSASPWSSPTTSPVRCPGSWWAWPSSL